MGTTGSMRDLVRSTRPVLWAVLALGVAVTVTGIGLAWQGTARSERPPIAVRGHATGGQDLGFVLGSPVVEVLHHRPGLTPLDAVRTSTFGWNGLTLREIRRDPAVEWAVRRIANLTALELVRLASDR